MSFSMKKTVATAAIFLASITASMSQIQFMTLECSHAPKEALEKLDPQIVNQLKKQNDTIVDAQLFTTSQREKIQANGTAQEMECYTDACVFKIPKASNFDSDTLDNRFETVLSNKPEILYVETQNKDTMKILVFAQKNENRLFGENDLFYKRTSTDPKIDESNSSVEHFLGITILEVSTGDNSSYTETNSYFRKSEDSRTVYLKKNAGALKISGN